MLFIVVPVAILAVVVGGFLLVVASQPDEINVSRTTTINAAPAVVFQQVNDLHQWEQWSPWMELDPDMKIEYTGPRSGEGAAYAWDGDDNVGAGTLKITESTPQKKVAFSLKFERPFEDQSTAAFHFAPAGEATEVTWEMHGENNFMGKVMSVFMDFEELIGKDFEKGLAKLKKVSENAAPGTAAPQADAEPPATDAAPAAGDTGVSPVK